MAITMIIFKIITITLAINKAKTIKQNNYQFLSLYHHDYSHSASLVLLVLCCLLVCFLIILYDVLVFFYFVEELHQQKK